MTAVRIPIGKTAVSSATSARQTGDSAAGATPELAAQDPAAGLIDTLKATFPTLEN
jgi:hypothetical protein